ncbi:hypothetical protein PIB30_099687 [Stylosanthes scabra]|uniref:Uncharacterized protein n=1 Tax=Stylosanthes scabra TaxID=79078 RepID=A0ABU6RWV1_9FABA|nr:hypothetical protein [Stylosanthes scabra]
MSVHVKDEIDSAAKAEVIVSQNQGNPEPQQVVPESAVSNGAIGDNFVLSTATTVDSRVGNNLGQEETEAPPKQFKPRE